MIKLQDFAKQKGVTDRAIQKHLKRHENELQGHFERKGKNGTWLDDFACSYLESLMITNPVVLSDAEQQREIEELRKKITELQEQLIQSQGKTIFLVEQMTEMQSQKLFLENKTGTLEEENKKLKTEVEEEKNRYQKSWFGLYKKVK